MAQYIHFTDEQKQRAAEVDLEEFLRQRGEKLLPSGRDKRLDRDHSVTIRGCEWFDHDSRQGGNAISFVRWFYNYSYPEAVKALLGGEQGTIYPSAAEREKPPQKPFELPEANTNMRRIFAYLMKHRHIDRDVIAYFAKAKTLFEDSKYHNCVFVGTDEQGVPRHAHKRSTNSQGKSFKVNVEGSRPQYSFHHVGQDGLLYVFEAPIDLLSFLTLYPEGWPASGMWCSAWITTSPDRRRPSASRKSYREQDTTAVSCSLCIRTGTTIWCRGRPWLALP